MAGTRIVVDYFFQDKTPEDVNKEHPELFLALHKAKAKTSKINEGEPNEENTVKGIYRICYHDEGDGHKPDTPEMEI